LVALSSPSSWEIYVRVWFLIPWRELVIHDSEHQISHFASRPEWIIF